MEWIYTLCVRASFKFIYPRLLPVSARIWKPFCFSGSSKGVEMSCNTWCSIWSLQIPIPLQVKHIFMRYCRADPRASRGYSLFLQKGIEDESIVTHFKQTSMASCHSFSKKKTLQLSLWDTYLYTFTATLLVFNWSYLCSLTFFWILV